MPYTATAIAIATARDTTDAIQARRRNTPSIRNSAASGKAAASELQASEWATGSRIWRYMLDTFRIPGFCCCRGRSLHDEDVETARSVHSLDAFEFDVAGGAGTGDEDQALRHRRAVALRSSAFLIANVSPKPRRESVAGGCAGSERAPDKAAAGACHRSAESTDSSNWYQFRATTTVGSHNKPKCPSTASRSKGYMSGGAKTVQGDRWRQKGGDRHCCEAMLSGSQSHAICP